MNRIDVDLPDSFAFNTTIALRVDDLNYGGHMGNETVLALVHEARIQFLEEHGYTEKDLEGVSLIMADAAVTYRREGYRGETLRIQVAAEGFTRTGFDLYFQLLNEDDAEVASVKTGMVSYDYENEEVVPLPQSVRTRLSADSS